MAKLYNLARVQTATTGTGTITLGSPVSPFLSFSSAGVGNGETVSYAIQDGANSETGRGVYTSSGTTLTRSVLKSTNSNTPINLSGSAQVVITAVAEDFDDAKARANHTGTQLASTISDLFSVTIPVVTTRAALKALNTGTTQNVFLRLGAQSGFFIWWTGDYSALVAMDTLEGYALKADAISASSGAWLRVTHFGTIDASFFGTDKTGSTATHGAVQVAVNVSAEAGLRCYFPPGRYKLGAKITVPENAWIVGGGKAAGLDTFDYTYFWADHSGPCFEIADNNGSRGFDSINFRRTQPTPGPGWAPTDYGAEINIIGGQDIFIENCHFHNVARCIKAIGDPATGRVNGRIFMENLTGQPLVSGIDLNHCLDVVWMDEIEFWVFWSNNANVVAHTRQNAVALTLGRVDNPEVGRMFGYSYFRGLLVNHAGVSGLLPTGTVSLATFDSFGSDNTGAAVIINGGTDGVRLRFGRLYGACNLADPAVTNEPFVWTLGNNARVYIGDLHGQYTNSSLVAMNGTGNRIVVVLARSLGIAYGGGGVPEFNLETGNTLTLLASPITSAAVKYPEITGSGIIETPDWRSFTPTITADAGSFTTVSATGKCRRLPGKSVLFQFHITVTTVGTASGFTNITLPYTNGSQWHFGAAREISATGLMCTATAAPAGTVAGIVTYNNVFATGSGTQTIGQIEYEAA